MERTAVPTAAMEWASSAGGAAIAVSASASNGSTAARTVLTLARVPSVELSVVTLAAASLFAPLFEPQAEIAIVEASAAQLIADAMILVQ